MPLMAYYHSSRSTSNDNHILLLGGRVAIHLVNDSSGRGGSGALLMKGSTEQEKTEEFDPSLEVGMTLTIIHSRLFNSA